MTKREKIILFLTGIVILYGAYSFIFPSKTKQTINNQQANFNTLKTELLKSLNQHFLTPKEVRIYQLLKQKQLSDPFLYTTAPKATPSLTENSQNLSIQFKYTGYVFLNNNRFAVINGKEYKEGEPLEIRGFSLLKVNESYILIKGPGKNNIIKVPFLDTLEIEGEEKP